MKKIGFTLTSFILILSIGVGFPIKCPDELGSCTCKIMAYGLHVKCVDFNDTRALVEGIKNLRTYKVQIVLLHNLILKEILPEGLFNGVEISELTIEKSNLTFSQPAFKGLSETLNVLNIAQRSVIKSTENFGIARLTNLTELHIKKNPLGTVKNSWLNGKLPNVEKIILDYDEITKIENQAFADMPRLHTISIAGNKIKEVKRSMFPKPAANLREIDLSGNEIPSLPEDFFSDMTALKKVVLSGNGLTTLPENTWKIVWKQLDTVVLFNNNLICDSGLNWITKVGWPEQVDGKCVAPSALIGKDIKDVYDTT